MSEPYTPTTEEVCECWTTRCDIGNPYETDADVEERHHEESVKFDRWLRKVKAEAWREGYLRRATADFWKPISFVLPNPYESEES